MIQFIASDLDGTLLQNGATELNPEIFDLIRELKKHDIHFIVATGRPYENCRYLFGPVKDEISYIVENGSLCIHNQNVVFRDSIDRDLVFRIADESKHYPNCHLLLSCEDSSYTDSKDPVYINHMQNVIKYKLKVVDDLRDLQLPFLKLATCDFNGTKEMASFFKEKFSSELKIVTSGNIWLDFLAPHTNKAVGLKHLLEYLNISSENGVCFGDEYNDVEMLQSIGTSYAMENSAPGIKQYADHVTDRVEPILQGILNSIAAEKK